MIRGKFMTSMDAADALFEIRKTVFADEMGLAAFGEKDVYDNMAVYALVMDEDGRPAGSGRLYVTDDAQFMLDRVCVLKEMRGEKFGDLLLRMLLFRAQEMELPHVTAVCPLDTVAFFARYGFKPTETLVTEGETTLRVMRVSAEEIDIEGSCGGHSKCAGCAGDCSNCM